MSESAFDEFDCTIHSKSGIRQVLKDNRVIVKAEKINGLYHVIASPAELNVLKNSDSMTLNETKIWHAKLGHIGNKGLLQLYKTGILPKQPIHLDFCENCVFGKASKLSFPKSTYTASAPLEYVHSDLWGPAQVDTIGGMKYFISFIDHFSRKVWITLLKSKSDAFSAFKNWKVMVESQSSNKLKCFKTDNGLEFCNADFDSFCANNGIKRHLTVPGTPQDRKSVV